MQTDIHFLSYLGQFFLEWKMFQTKVAEKIKTHILCSVTFFRKSCRLWDNVEKFCREGWAADANKVHAHCMLDTWGYKHTHTICNVYCFSTATMVARKRPIVTLHVRCLSSLFFAESVWQQQSASLPPFSPFHNKRNVPKTYLSCRTILMLSVYWTTRVFHFYPCGDTSNCRNR